MSQTMGLFETKSDYAYRLVRDRILTGELAAGATLQQRDLATELGISTTPLREALRRLASEGLVELDSHRDARIAPLRAEEARDLLEVRRSLDPLAAGLAAERRTSSDLAELRASVTEVVPLGANPSLAQLIAHRRFHAAVYRASHNELLIATLDTLWDKADRYRRLMLQSDPGARERERTEAEHLALVQCIVERDAQGAASLMRRHIDASHGAKAMWRLGNERD